ncbi:hypothetical protein GCM10010301_63680 [Streptomyces plicatus]|nr:hypothetical protein GCM10010301_63680 [Streptomyces plicatus]
MLTFRPNSTLVVMPGGWSGECWGVAASPRVNLFAGFTRTNPMTLERKGFTPASAGPSADGGAAPAALRPVPV